MLFMITTKRRTQHYPRYLVEECYQFSNDNFAQQQNFNKKEDNIRIYSN